MCSRMYVENLSLLSGWQINGWLIPRGKRCLFLFGIDLGLLFQSEEMAGT